MTNWAQQRLAELHAAAPAKRRKIQPYARVPLDLAAKAAAATGDRRLFVLIWILHRTWRRGTPTVVVSSTELRKYGISRDVKRRALEKFEAAGLIAVEWRSRRNPVVALIRH